MKTILISFFISILVGTNLNATINLKGKEKEKSPNPNIKIKKSNDLKVNIYEVNEQVNYIINIAGVNNIKVNINKKTQPHELVVSGIKTIKPRSTTKTIIKEMKEGKVQRSFKLPRDYKEKTIQTKYSNGMLNITVLK